MDGLIVLYYKCVNYFSRRIYIYIYIHIFMISLLTQIGILVKEIESSKVARLILFIFILDKLDFTV